MLPCRKGKRCAYSDDIPGNCHLTCLFNWELDLENIPRCQVDHGRQWFNFPLNYDPGWGADECPHKSDKKDQSKVVELSPLAKIGRLF